MTESTRDSMPLHPHPPPGEALFAPHLDPQRQRLSEWFREPAGQRAALGEQQVIARHLSNLFGYNLLQVGVLPGVDLLATSRVLHRSVMDLGGADPVPPCDSVLRGSAGCLPIESDCMDVVVLPHVVEFEPSPHDALREAARVLIPEGHLVLTSFSPRSLFGLWRLAARHRHAVPWSGHFFTSSRLRDWLELLGFDLLDVVPLFFEPPVRIPRTLEPLKSMQPALRRLCPLFAGCHVMLARKRIATVTPIRPRFAYRRRLVGVSLAGPPARLVNRVRLHDGD